MPAWERCTDAGLKLEQFEGEPCVIGMDLASKIDIAALILLFERGDKVIPFGRFYLPQTAIDDARNGAYRG
jgi:phage terminase large subunit-like protein